MFFKKNIFIGLDVGHYSVKAAVLGPNRKQILDLSEVEVLPNRAFIEDPVPDEATAAAILKAVESYSDLKKYAISAAVSVQGDGVIGRYVEFPPLDMKKLEVAIQSAAVKIVPFSLDEAVLARIPVRKLVSSEERTEPVFLMAMKKNFIERKQRLSELCGQTPKQAEMYTFPLIRSFTANHDPIPGVFCAVIHVGSRMTSVVVLREGNPYYIRNFPIAGKDFTYAFQMGKQSTWQEAEENKKAYDVLAGEVFVEPVLGKWMEQIRKSFDSFAKMSDRAPLAVDRVFLTGGSAGWKHFDKRLSEYLKLPVAVENWEKIKPEKEWETAPYNKYNIALGLYQ